MSILRWFTRHPEAAGETYGEHFIHAAGYGAALAAAAAACLVHALAPALFERTASGIVDRLHARMSARKRMAAAGRSAASSAGGVLVSATGGPAGSACVEGRGARAFAFVRAFTPGVTLGLGVALGAWALAGAQRAVFGSVRLEPLALAILIGATVRLAWAPGLRWEPGLRFACRSGLEAAIVLLGAAFSVTRPAQVAGLAGVVVVAVGLALVVGYGLGRLLGLSPRMATLVSCGNAICGHSAIVAVAPAVGADAEEVAAAIGFTAVLGTVVVLGLPVAGRALELDDARYGALAGLTVYAVPQVLAAAAPMGATAMQIGAMVKLLRVLMLAPVCLALGLAARARRFPPLGAGGAPLRIPAPWFILGFVVMAGLRGAGAIPAATLSPLAALQQAAALLSMAALGLMTDARAVGRAGWRVGAAACVALLFLGAAALALVDVAPPT